MLIVAFGPILVGYAIWHYVTNRDSDSSSMDPPSDGPGGQEPDLPPESPSGHGMRRIGTRPAYRRTSTVRPRFPTRVR
ncbi:MAG: hypothetical protein AAGI08_02335 [Bacteroidota bacterium]